MKPEQMQKQLAKWRNQERVNKIIVYTTVIILGLVVLTGVGIFAVNQFRPTPTLTPSEFVREFPELHGKVVKIKGRVRLIADDEYRIRVADDKEISVLCHLTEVPELKDGEEVTVQGKVDPQRGLIECRVVD
jgi:DNA/RNA endonuclease YhcR with UshA esterase domain